jgi:hypothetical protein
MVKFLYNAQLYETILQKSSETKENLLVCSPSIGLGAHEIFSEEILIKPPADIRFLFRLNELAVKKGEVNPNEIQYLIEHFKGIKVKYNENFHSNIYIFDNSALITSAPLTKAALESNIEAGVLLEEKESVELKDFFNDCLWNSAKAITDLKKYKQIWNLAQRVAKKTTIKKVKPHTEIKEWTNNYINTWYIGVPRRLLPKFERKIKKETNWRTDLSLLGDVGYSAFLHLKLGDKAYIADLSKGGKIRIELVRISDKARVETDEGDYHASYETAKTYLQPREQFFEMLKSANIKFKTSEMILNKDQLNQIATVLSSIKQKRTRKPIHHNI